MCIVVVPNTTELYPHILLTEGSNRLQIARNIGLISIICISIIYCVPLTWNSIFLGHGVGYSGETWNMRHH